MNYDNNLPVESSIDWYGFIIIHLDPGSVDGRYLHPLRGKAEESKEDLEVMGGEGNEEYNIDMIFASFPEALDCKILFAIHEYIFRKLFLI